MKGSLVVHLQTHNGVAKGGLGKVGNNEGGGSDPSTYRMVYPEKSVPRPCPVEGCSGRAETRTEVRIHFWHRHVRDTLVILKELNLPFPRCPLGDMLMPWRSLNGIHRRTAQFRKGMERKLWRLALEEERAVTSREFSAYGGPL